MPLQTGFRQPQPREEPGGARRKEVRDTRWFIDRPRRVVPPADVSDERRKLLSDRRGCRPGLHLLPRLPQASQCRVIRFVRPARFRRPRASRAVEATWSDAGSHRRGFAMFQPRRRRSPHLALILLTWHPVSRRMSRGSSRPKVTRSASIFTYPRNKTQSVTPPPSTTRPPSVVVVPEEAHRVCKHAEADESWSRTERYQRYKGPVPVKA